MSHRKKISKTWHNFRNAIEFHYIKNNGYVFEILDILEKFINCSRDISENNRVVLRNFVEHLFSDFQNKFIMTTNI